MTNDNKKLTHNYSRIAIVTGASSGIGEGIVRKFIASGYGVVGNARSADKLIALENELGEAFCGVAGDASEHTTIEALFIAAINHFGKAADIVVANAGRGLGGSVKDADLSQFDAMLKLNVSGTLVLLQKAAQNMVNQQQSNSTEQALDIVVIGSVVGRHISPFSAVYGATKFAVHSLTEGLRREVGPKGIRVSLVEPGIVISGFQDAANYGDELVQQFNNKWGPLLQPHDVANAIHFIISQPVNVHISDIMIRPTKQDNP